eukprot:PhF_6_TR22137/c0_g1_i1/m.31316
MDDMVKCIAQHLQRNPVPLDLSTLCSRFLQYDDIIATLPDEILFQMNVTELPNGHVLIYLRRILDSPCTPVNSVKLAKSTIHRCLNQSGRESSSSSSLFIHHVMKNTKRFKKLTPTCRCLVAGMLWSDVHFHVEDWIVEGGVDTTMITTILEMIPNEGIDIDPCVNFVVLTCDEGHSVLLHLLLKKLNKKFVLPRLLRKAAKPTFTSNTRFTILASIIEASDNVLSLQTTTVDEKLMAMIKPEFNGDVRCLLPAFSWNFEGSEINSTVFLSLFEFVHQPMNISFSKCAGVNDETLIAVSKACNRSLQQLTLAAIREKITDLGIEAIASSCTLLRHLDVSNTGGTITNGGIQAIASSCPSLQYL